MRLHSSPFSIVAGLFILVAAPAAFAGSVTVSPSSLYFGNQVLNVASATKTVTLTNGLTKTLSITSITVDGDFSQSDTCPRSPSTLAVGGTCTLTVTFTPTVLGSRTGTVKVNDNASGSPQKVTLNGTGVASVTATPASLGFGNQVLNKKSTGKTVTVKNNQTTALTIYSISADLGDYSISNSCPKSPATLAAGATCTATVYFTPAVAGLRSSTLTVSDNAAASPTVSLSGTGIYPAVASPSSLNFASQPVGTSSAAQLVTLTNNQTTGLKITSVAPSSGEFPTAHNCPISPSKLAAGASCTASVSFAPAAVGARSGTLTFSDDASNSPQTVTLTGTGGGAVLTSIAVTPAMPSAAAGTTQQFTATGTYSDGSTQNITSSVAWSTGSGSVATITSAGLASAVQVGSTAVTATDTSTSITGSTTLTVTPAVLNSIAVTPALPSIAKGVTQQFTATGTFSDGSTQDLTATVQWSSSATSVATISNAAGSQGLATSVATGNSTITATQGTASGSTTLTVMPASLATIAVTPANPSLAQGTTQQFTATGTLTDGTTTDLTASATWSSSSPGTASISSGGLATAVATGQSTISAASGSITGSTSLTVTPAALISIAINPPSATAAAGATQGFTATGTFSDGTTQDVTQSGHWSSSDGSIATISNSAPTQGVASALAAGSVTISISSGTVSGSASLSVTAAALSSITVSPPSPSIALGNTQQFTATGSYTDGTTQDLTTVATWSSSSAPVAVISNNAGSNGLASSAGVGTATITATSGSVSGTAVLTVGSAVLTSITVSPSNPSMAAGGTQQFTAQGTYSDGTAQDITGSVAWSSSATAVAAISSGGLATGLGAGSTVISAGLSGTTGTTTLTVSQAAGTVTVTPSIATLGAGSNMQFAATVSGIAGGVTWQVNGVNGGRSDLGTIDASGLYLAPATLPSTGITVTALGSDGISSGSAGVTISSPDPLGSVTSSTTIACGTRKMASPTCYQLNVLCPGVPDENAYLVVSNPTVAVVGSAMFLTGGGDTSLYESQFTYGTTAMNTALNAGYQVVQLTFGSPFSSGNPDGWLTGSPAGGGPRKAACRVATLAKWAHDNLGNSSKPFCGTGNSAGGQALAYAVAYYGMDSTFTMIEPTAGPPFARLDWGCDALQPKVYSSCPNVTVGYSIGVSNAQNFIDPSYGDPRCSTDIGNKSAINDAQFLSDSLLGGGAKTSFATTVRVVFGGQDTSTGFNHAQAWIGALQTPATSICITDAGHDLASVLDGAQQIGNDIVNYCVASGH